MPVMKQNQLNVSTDIRPFVLKLIQVDELA